MAVGMGLMNHCVSNPCVCVSYLGGRQWWFGSGSVKALCVRYVCSSTSLKVAVVYQPFEWRILNYMYSSDLMNNIQ